VQSSTTRTPLLAATSAFGLGRRCWSSQQCYLHCLPSLMRQQSKFIISQECRNFFKGFSEYELSALSALTLLVGCQEEEHRAWKIEWWGVGVVICLERGADCLHIVQLMPLCPKAPSFLVSFKSRLDLPFWYWLTQVSREKRPLNGCSSSEYFFLLTF